MVGVLVGHDDRVEVGQVVPVRREVAGVDEDPRVGDLHEEASMTEVGESHD